MFSANPASLKRNTRIVNDVTCLGTGFVMRRLMRGLLQKLMKCVQKAEGLRWDVDMANMIEARFLLRAR